MGTNMVGDIKHWILPPLGRWSNVIGTIESQSLALARYSRRNPGSRSRHDSTGDVDKSTRRVHPDRSASPGIHRNNGSTGVCTQQDRTGTYQPGYLQGSLGGVAGMVLDRDDLQLERLCWFLYVFQEGAVEQALDSSLGDYCAISDFSEALGGGRVHYSLVVLGGGLRSIEGGSYIRVIFYL